MIYTVTFNPSLDYVVTVEDFQLGLTNRTSSEQLFPGGKGINVSIVLKNLGLDSTALGFVAGFTGEEITRRLQELGIRCCFIQAGNGFSRINLKLASIDGTEINGAGPVISPDRLKLLTEQLDALQEGDVLFLSGSIPSSMPDDTYEKIMRQLQGRGVLTVVDATRELLLKVLPYRPFLIKPNHHELGEIFGAAPARREEVVPYGRKLQDMGARNVLISMAGEGAVLIAEDGSLYESPAPRGTLVSGVGAGDSMVAGFMAGWMEGGSYEHAFYLGLASGSATAFSEGLADEDSIRSLCARITNQR